MRRAWNSSPVRFIREMIVLYFDKNVSRSAAELAYFLILSFFPILICINAFIASLHLNPSAVIAAADSFLPRESLGILGEYITYINANQSSSLLIAGIGMTMFSASAAMRSLMNIMDEIYEHECYEGVWRLVASFVFSVLMLITIYLSITVVITGTWFFHLLERNFGLHNVAGDWPWMRFLLLFCFVLLFVLLIYRMSAPRGKPRPPVLRGALLAAAALVAFSMLFSWFIAMFSRYSLIYGSLASVIILLVWLYLCGNILILGNIVNRVLHQRRRKRGAKTGA